MTEGRIPSREPMLGDVWTKHTTKAILRRVVQSVLVEDGKVTQVAYENEKGRQRASSFSTWLQWVDTARLEHRAE